MKDSNQRIAHLASAQKCTGCLACVETCRHGALEVRVINNISYPVINHDKCVGCGLCERICPVIKPINNDYDLNEVRVVAAWNSNDEIRLNAASGGFCTTMSLDMIRKRGKVALCVWKDGRASFVLTDNKHVITEAANSKYVQSDTNGIYKKVNEALNAGDHILFIGLPCQVAGLYGYLRHKNYEGLKTVELICSAPPSTEAIKIQEDLAQAGQIVRFRTKTEGCRWGSDYNIQLNNAGVLTTIHKKDQLSVFYEIFASSLTSRYSCMNCQYAKTQRIADYTVGDFHGYRTEGGDKGVSLVICKNVKAYNYLKGVENLVMENSSLSCAISSNYRLYTGWDALRYHPVNLFRTTFNRLPKSIRYAFLTNKQPYRLLWLFYKMFTKINILIQRRRVLKVCK